MIARARLQRHLQLLKLSFARAMSTVKDDATIFDKILNGTIPSDCVHETDHVYCFRDVNPVSPTHVLCIPKVRDGLTGLNMAEERHESILGKLMVAASTVAKLENLNEGYRIVVNDGKEGCQSVLHLHLHVIGGRQLAWPPG
jgi:diadenosine tetraphosphate (Ap4A) HIT family hydrolase